MEENKTTAVVSDAPEKAPVIPRNIYLNRAYRVEGRTPVFKAYSLTSDVAEGLKALADPGCYKCLSTGVADWRAGGLKARVCKCVLAKQAAIKAAEATA